ncbi:MAG: hypothetical protein IJB59_12525 [Oscillospiraceae bacterium]|nr:hypothetical protein [Oscillospiraceae bacterium]
MSKKTKFLVALGAVFLVVGVPIIINECYKANCGYITVWDGSDLLGYYGTILGSVIAVISIIVTIAFTKKQIQRDSFLKNENEKWDRLKSIFLQTLSDINPMRILKDVMDNGFTDPTKAITLLQRYQLDCKIANDLLNAHLNMNDYPKFKELIDSIATTAEVFVDISQKEIDQYSDFRLLQHKDTALEMLNIEKERPGSFSKENIAFNKDILEKIKTISHESINRQITQLNTEFIQAYEEKYRALLQLTGSTFETIAIETQRQADSMLSFGKACNGK